MASLVSWDRNISKGDNFIWGFPENWAPSNFKPISFVTSLSKLKAKCPLTDNPTNLGEDYKRDLIMGQVPTEYINAQKDRRKDDVIKMYNDSVRKIQFLTTKMDITDIMHNIYTLFHALVLDTHSAGYLSIHAYLDPTAITFYPLKLDVPIAIDSITDIIPIYPPPNPQKQIQAIYPSGARARIKNVELAFLYYYSSINDKMSELNSNMAGTRGGKRKSRKTKKSKKTHRKKRRHH
jgi:hypothetical protein